MKILNKVLWIRRLLRNKDADGLVLKKLPYLEVVGSLTCLLREVFGLDW